MTWMLRMLRLVLVLSCLLVSLQVAAFETDKKSSNERVTPFRICYEQTANPPYSVIESSGKRSGIFLDLLSQVVSTAELRPIFYRRSWKRCQNDLKNGVADATFAMIWTKERARWARFPLTEEGTLRREARLWSGIYRVFVHTDSTLSWDGKGFNHLVFGLNAPLGYIAYQKLHALGVILTEPLDQVGGLQQVARQRLDGYVLDQQIGLYLACQLGIEAELRYLSPPFMSSDWYLPISHSFYKRYPEQSEAVWQELMRLRELIGPALVQHYRYR